MRILICIGRLYMGGIEKYAVDLAIGLKEKGHKVEMLVFFNIYNEEKLLFLAQNDVKVHEMRLRSGRDMRGIIKFYKLLKQIQPDIVHMNILPLFASIPLFFSKTIKIYTVHQISYNAIQSEIYKNMLHGIIAVSKSVSEVLINKGLFTKKKIKVIHNGIKIPEKKVQYKLDEVITLLMVCRLAKDKHPDVAVDIIHFLNNFSTNKYKLVFVGAADAADNEYVNSIHFKIKEKKIENIEFTGWKEDVYEYMSSAHGLLVLSDSESFGYSAIEAMSHGLPIFSYFVKGGMHEFHIKNQTGVVIHSRDPIELAKEIDRVFADPIIWKQMSNSAFSASTRFSVQQMVDKTELLYKKLRGTADEN